MARRKVKKSDRIRKTLTEMGLDARPRDVVAALSAKHIKVSAAQVSTLRKQMAEAGPANARSMRSQKNSGKISLAVLLSAKQLVTESGSVQEAREALQALERLL